MEYEKLEFVFKTSVEADNFLNNIRNIMNNNKILKLSDLYKVLYKDNKDIYDYYDNFGWYNLYDVEIINLKDGNCIIQMPEILLIDKNIKLN